MKKLYGLMGLTGFILMIGTAGASERASFHETAVMMAFGLALLLVSLLLTKSHNIRMRKRRQLYMKRKSELKKALGETASVKRRIPSGISEIIGSGVKSVCHEINSPELYICQ